jgi:ferrochelatase
MQGDGISRCVVVSLYPQYSIATTGSSLARLHEVLKGSSMQTVSISSWFDHPLYIEAMVSHIRKGLESFAPAEDVQVLFSAHSLPVKFIKEGDPYADQIRQTIALITKRLDVGWDLSFQSKSGPVEWLGPSTDEKIVELARRGVKNLLVVPISFVSDHIETLYEIDILYKSMAQDLGVRLERMESLNTSSLFIEALKDIVEKRLAQCA